MSLRLSWLDGNDIGSKLGEFGQHKLMQAFANGGEQYYCSNANRNSKPGEEAAYPIR